MRTLFALLILILVTHLSFAEVYKWTDEKGIVHFTDDITQVPEGHRSGAERMGLPDQQPDTKTETPPSSKEREEPYRDRLGRGEEYWRGRVEEWKKKLIALQASLEALRGKYNELTEKFNDSKNSAERGILRKERDQVKSEMDQCRIQIAEAREMLEKKIPDEAQFYKAKPEWIKP